METIRTPNEIEVGQKYTWGDEAGYVYLGVGKRKLFTSNEYHYKHLVCVESGLIMQEGDDAREDVWAIGFKKIK